MNEQRRGFFKNSALGLATITLGAGLSLIPSAQAEEKPSNTATTAVENLPEIEAELTLAPNVIVARPSALFLKKSRRCSFMINLK